MSLNIHSKSFSILLVFLSIVFSLFLIEGVLRVFGHTPWTPVEIDSNEPTVHEPHPVLGWRNKEGTYLIPAYSAEGKDIHMSFLGHGQRPTKSQGNESKKELVIVGGSFTQGWAIDDDETYSWKLQNQYPFLNVLNYGTGGYGSYQSMLVLDNELGRLNSPDIVLYGFIQHHEDRNVASWGWLRSLAQLSRRGHVFLPYGTIDDDQKLVRHAPERYVALPLRGSSATIQLIEKAYMSIQSKKRHSLKREVTEQILLEMQKITEQHGAKFVVILLQADQPVKQHYQEFFQTHNVQHIDCAFTITPDMKVPGEGHPNGTMNSRYADCIVNGLGDQMEGYQ